MDQSNRPEATNEALSTQGIDNDTLSYLKGQISFQDYESIIENNQISKELTTINSLNYIEESYDSSGSSPSKKYNYIYDINEGNSQGFSLETNSPNLSNSNTKLQPIKKKSTHDRFLNLKNIINSNEDSDDCNNDEVTNLGMNSFSLMTLN